jgi:hypothetical protein
MASVIAITASDRRDDQRAATYPPTTFVMRCASERTSAATGGNQNSAFWRVDPRREHEDREARDRDGGDHALDDRARAAIA